MEVKIKSDVCRIFNSKIPAYAGLTKEEMRYLDILWEMKGKTYSVDTKYLFKNGFNVLVKLENETKEIIVFILNEYVEEIINDERIRKEKDLK